MSKSQRRDNFGTFLRTVRRKSQGGELDIQQSPMTLLRVLMQHDGRLGIVQLAEESHLPIYETVNAINSLKGAQILTVADSPEEVVALTPTGEQLAELAVAKLEAG